MNRKILARLLLPPLVALPVACAAPSRPEPAIPTPNLPEQVRAILRDHGRAATRWGMLVTDMAGREIIAIAADERFVPASNTKLLTTATALATLEGLDGPDEAAGTEVRLAMRAGGSPDIVLIGKGDARLSDRADCTADCLQTLAGIVAGSGVAHVHDVIGDDRLFPDERWGPGWSWNNLQTRSGTAVSALSLNDNVASFTVTPGPAAGAAPILAWDGGESYFLVRNDATTVDAGKTDLRVERQPGSRIVRLYGVIAMGAEPEPMAVGVDDPAEFAAFHFRRLLEARGVHVDGVVTVRHRALALSDEHGTPVPPVAGAPPLARLSPPPLGEDIRHLLKVSQNLHAELLLRRVSLASGSGSTADGLAAERRVLAQAGVAREAFDISDGSGMSSYNRVSPRAIVTLLRWASGQPWGAAWRDSLPVGGVDGTLAHRFRDTPLAGKIFAKTGTLNAANGLSGYLVAASGRTLAFSIFANDMPGDAPPATTAMDQALLAIAAAN